MRLLFAALWAIATPATAAPFTATATISTASTFLQKVAYLRSAFGTNGDVP